MKARRILALIPSLLLVAVQAMAADAKPPSAKPSAHMSKETRMQIIRAFNAELIYIRTPFPMGKVGLKLRNGAVSPSGAELQQLIAMWGPAAKPGDGDLCQGTAGQESSGEEWRGRI